MRTRVFCCCIPIPLFVSLGVSCLLLLALWRRATLSGRSRQAGQGRQASDIQGRDHRPAALRRH
jgi:hypothetical protein